MKKTILFGLLVVFFGVLLVSTAFAGAPPSVGGPAGGPGGPTTPGKRGAISFELGYYTPSLKTLNDDLTNPANGFPEIGGNLLLAFKGMFATPGSPVYPYVGVSYWAGATTRETDKTEAKITLISIPCGVQVPILTGTLPQQVMLYIDVGGDVAISFWHYEEASGDYYNANALGYDIAAKVGSEYFIVPNRFSIGGFIGYAFLGKTSQLTVTDSTLLGWEVNDKLETSKGEETVFELTGITFMFDIRLWF